MPPRRGRSRESARPRQCQLRHTTQYAVRGAPSTHVGEAGDEPRGVPARAADRLAPGGGEREPLHPRLDRGAVPSAGQARHRATGVSGSRRAESARGASAAARRRRRRSARRRRAPSRRHAPSRPASRSAATGRALRQQELELGAQAVSREGAVDVEPGGLGGQPARRAGRSGIPAARRSGPRGRCAWGPPRTTAGGARGSVGRGGRRRPAGRVDEPPPLRAVEPDGERVQREVPAPEVLRERRPLHGGQRARPPGRTRAARSRSRPGGRPAGRRSR